MACTGLVRLRRATVDDAPDIARVHVRTWQSAYRGLMPRALLDSLTFERRSGWWKGELELVADDHRPWVAVDDERVVGFVHAGPAGTTRRAAGLARSTRSMSIPIARARASGATCCVMPPATSERTASGRRCSGCFSTTSRRGASMRRRVGRPTAAERVESLGGVDIKEVRYTGAELRPG